MKDTSTFPSPIYKDVVLEPLFEGSKKFFKEGHLAIDQAHCVMLVEQKIISTDEGSKILNALEEIQQEVNFDEIKYTGEFEDYFFFIEHCLKEKLGADLAGRLHTGRSRNDIDHTLFKLNIKKRLLQLNNDLEQLINGVLSVCEQNYDTVVVAYTHGQPAQPTTFAHYLSALVEVLLRDKQRLLNAMDTVNLSPMGAAAITTSGFDLDRNRVAELLGFEKPLYNSYGCISSCDYITSVYSAMKLVFIHIGRFVQDMAQWSSFETGHLYVPNAFVQISSIMPQKRNPVPIEHMRLIASKGMGLCDTLVNAMHNTPFTDMNDSESESQQVGFLAFDNSHRLLSLLTAFVTSVQINETKVHQHLDQSCATITELADTLVRKENLSFRQAHHVVAELATYVVEHELSLQTVSVDIFTQIFEKHIGRSSQLTEDDLRFYVSAKNFIAVRDGLGGPAPSEMRKAVSQYKAQLQSSNAQWSSIETFTLNAIDVRSKVVTDLITKRS
tara:strand:- start:4830 stop:6326 length:1497 start_codon:yes stop_codon:yes gene_type:complete